MDYQLSQHVLLKSEFFLFFPLPLAVSSFSKLNIHTCMGLCLASLVCLFGLYPCSNITLIVIITITFYYVLRASRMRSPIFLSLSFLSQPSFLLKKNYLGLFFFCIHSKNSMLSFTNNPTGLFDWTVF